MAVSTKSRAKARESHSKASPAFDRRTRSTSRPLSEKDYRRGSTASKPASRYTSDSSKQAQRTRTSTRSRQPESDYEDKDAESDDSEKVERRKRTQLKQQKAKLRAGSPNEDLYQSSSSSDPSSSSDGVQVIIQAKRAANSASSKSRPSSAHAPLPAKKKATEERPKPHPAMQPQHAFKSKRRLDSDSVSPPPLRVSTSAQPKSPVLRAKARPSAGSKQALPSSANIQKAPKSPSPVKSSSSYSRMERETTGTRPKPVIIAKQDFVEPAHSKSRSPKREPGRGNEQRRPSLVTASPQGRLLAATDSDSDTSVPAVSTGQLTQRSKEAMSNEEVILSKTIVRRKTAFPAPASSDDDDDLPPPPRHSKSNLSSKVVLHENPQAKPKSPPTRKRLPTPGSESSDDSLPPPLPRPQQRMPSPPHPLPIRTLELDERDTEESPSEPPENYVGASAQLYIEQSGARHLERGAAATASVQIFETSQILASHRHTVELRAASESKHLSLASFNEHGSSTARPTSAEDARVESKTSTLSSKARKSTVPATARSEERDPSFDLTVRTSKSPSVGKPSRSKSPKLFQRLTRSSSDEDSTADEAAVIEAVLSPQKTLQAPKVAPRLFSRDSPVFEGEPARRHSDALAGPSYSQHSPEPFRPASAEDDNYALLTLRKDVHDTETNLEQEGVHEAGQQQEALRGSPYHGEDIPVPEAESPPVQKYPSPPRPEEPRFTATSRIISQSRKSRSGPKKKERQLEYDMDIPVPYDGHDEDAGEESRDDQSAVSFDNDAPLPDVKPKRVALSKRARKATGGISAEARRPARRRVSEIKRRTRDEDVDDEDASETDSFGDNGAIVSDTSVDEDRSDEESYKKRPSQNYRGDFAPYDAESDRRRDRRRPPVADNETEAKRRRMSMPRPEVVIHSTTSRRKSSIAAPNKPTKPSRSARPSGVRHYFEDNGISRRKSLNERLSDEDSESSDDVEVMKSSTLEVGQSADAVLRAMSRERESRERSQQSENVTFNSRDKGKQRARDEDDNPYEAEDTSRLLEEHISQNGRELADEDARTPDYPDANFDDDLFPTAGDAEQSNHALFFDPPIIEHTHRDGKSSMDIAKGLSSSRTVETERESPQSSQNIDRQVAYSSRLPAFPQEVLDAVQNASSATSRETSQDGSRRRNGPTPPNGRRRRQDLGDEYVAEEEEEVIVQDSAIVKDPHGRMIRKEEMLELIAEHARLTESKARARMLSEDAEGSLVDESDIDDDHFFNISISRFEMHIEELPDAEPSEVMDQNVQAIQGIVEEFEESFWEDEAEIFVAQQLLRRHQRRRSMRISDVNSADLSATTALGGDNLYQRPDEGRLSTPTGQSSAQEDQAQQSPLAQSVVETMSPGIAHSPDREAIAPESIGGRTTEDTSSSRVVSKGANALSESIFPRTTTETSPELPITATPRNRVSRGSPSKVSPTRHRKSESPFKPKEVTLQTNGILQAAIRDDDVDLQVEQEPIIAPSVYHRRPEPFTAATADPDMPSDTQPQTTPLVDSLLDANGSEAVLTTRRSTISPRSTLQDHGVDGNASPSNRLKRKQANVYVEVQASPRSSPARKKIHLYPGAEGSVPLREDAAASEAQAAAPLETDATTELHASLVTDVSAEHTGLAEDAETSPPHDKRHNNASTEGPVDDPRSVNNAQIEQEESLTEILEDHHLETVTTAIAEGQEVAIEEESPVASRVSNEMTEIVSVQQVLVDPSDPTTAPATESGAVEVSVSVSTTEAVDISTMTTDNIATEAEASDLETQGSSASSSTEAAPSQEDVFEATERNLEADGLQDTEVPTGVSASEPSTAVTSTDDGSSDESSDDAEGEDLEEEVDDIFRIGRLLAWADAFKDIEKPHLITASSAQKLLEQAHLSTEGAFPVLLAWKLGSGSNGDLVKADFVSLMRENEIDSPAKLSSYMTNLQNTTFAISSHLRYPSTADGDSDSQPIRTWRIPGDYRSFYDYSFDYASGAEEAGMLNRDQARNLWWIVLAPALRPGQDLVDFMDSQTSIENISKEDWTALLDACTSTGPLDAPQVGDLEHELDVVKAFRSWLANRANGSSIQSTDDTQLATDAA